MPIDDYVTLGHSGLRVSPFCLGAMTFGQDDWGSSVADSQRIMDAYIDRGGNFIDTANLYTRGRSEKIIGEHLGHGPRKRQRLVLATKFFGSLFPGDPNAGGTSRKAIHAQLDESLRRLETDYVDLYWMHAWDKFTPIDETMRTLDDLVRAGKIRYIGFSDTPAWKVAEAQVTAQLRGLSPLVALQIEYSLLERTVEGEFLAMADELGLGVMPWSPLKNGVLTGKYARRDKGNHAPDRGAFALPALSDDRTFDVIECAERIASELDATVAQVALAWLCGRRAVASPVVGARTIGQLEQNLKALDLRLTDLQRQQLDEASKPQLAFPAAFLEFVGRVAYGGTTIRGVSYPATPYAPKSDADRY
ncbi:L-fuco-beta-pyranose dehydrogenase [Labilithrix luteola]|uniref:L-fuco-beta-pyranose dehydrogenase n=1 Tax=Labilithrix luteola TaxID=1391654 RepID=A0A0K1PYB8_9BACT|nr:aldo/keto reductase [Labilithrix luteola]AKU98376.1 L-fuco-beta-pyranose dehydrogenase [Labilithrix luteola]